MGRLYVNQTLEKQIRQYCEMNEIEDINAFANRCLAQGFSVVKFGTSPKDNFERENKGIKDIKKNESRKKRDTKGGLCEEHKENPEEKNIERPIQREEVQNSGRDKGLEESSKPSQERKEGVTVRKIQIIKKG